MIFFGNNIADMYFALSRLSALTSSEPGTFSVPGSSYIMNTPLGGIPYEETDFNACSIDAARIT